MGIYYTAASGTGEPPAAQPSYTQGPPFTGGSADRIWEDYQVKAGSELPASSLKVKLITSALTKGQDPGKTEANCFQQLAWNQPRAMEIPGLILWANKSSAMVTWGNRWWVTQNIFLYTVPHSLIGTLKFSSQRSIIERTFVKRK